MKNSGIAISSLNAKMQAQLAAQMDRGLFKPSKWVEVGSPPIASAYPVFTLPYPPSSNSAYATFNNRRILSKAGREYKQRVASMAFTLGIKVLTGPVTLTVEVYRPIKSGDLSNRLKILEDSLKGIAWEDDKQVVQIIARRFDDKENPRVRVRIEPALDVHPNLG